MSRLRNALGIFVSVAVLVAAGVAGARGTFFTSEVVDEAMVEVVETPEPCEPSEDPEGDEPVDEEPVGEEGDGEIDEGEIDEGEIDEGEVDEGEREPEDCEPEDDEGEEPEAEVDDGDEDEPSAMAQGDRGAACDAAAGIEESPLPEGERLKGLDNAISRVLENCKKNPQAPGLLVALERLSENRARKAAHDEVKAERKAEREARKAERKAERAAVRAEREAGNQAGPPPHAGPPGGGGPPGQAKGEKG